MTLMDSTTTSEEILEHIKEIFVEIFELDGGDVELETRLYEDLDIDSIDAVDLMIALKKKTGKELNQDEFKQIRTVGDVVEVVGAQLTK